MGNSLTAGFMDGGLMKAGQANSYPQLIAMKMGLDSEEFSQPWIEVPGIGSTAVEPDSVAGVMRFTGAGIGLLGKTFRDLDVIRANLLLAAAQPTPYHNLGVPGALLTEAMIANSSSTSLTGNLFFDFINRASLFGDGEETSGYPTPPDGIIKPVTFKVASMFRQTVAKGPGLATLWLGNNDVLGAALSGNPNNPTPITPIGDFTEQYTDLMSMLAGGLARRTGWDPVAQTGVQPTIVVANIPSITSIPHFIPTAQFEAAIAASGAPVPGYDEGVVDFVLLPALSWVPGHLGQDLPSSLTLTAAEVTLLETAVGGYNQVIAGVAAAVGGSGVAKVGMFDAHARMAEIAGGGSEFGPTAAVHFLFLYPNVVPEIQGAADATLFSLDGIHPNNKGYGVVANGFIDAINAVNGTSIPQVDVSQLTWDPTYGVPVVKTASGSVFTISPDAAASMQGMFH